MYMKPKKEKKHFTDAHQRLWLLLKRTSKSQSFRERLIKMRIDFGIPPKGYEKKPLDYEHFGYNSFAVPESWTEENSPARFEELHNGLDVLTDGCDLGVIKAYPQIFYWIIFYGLYMLPDKVGTVVIKDMVEVKKWTDFGKLEENYLFPIAIFISPHASRNDILDFVKTNSDRIKKLQAQYAEKTPPLKNVRRREPLAPTKFILQQEGKPHQEIANLANKKFDRAFTYSDVGKILNNKRKKER